MFTRCGKNESFFLFLLVSLSVFLRCYHIDYKLLWFDEAYTYLTLPKPFSEIVRNIFLFSGNSIGHLILLKPFYHLFQTEIIGRYFSVFFSTGSILFFFLILKQITNDPLTRIFSTFCFSIHPVLLWHAQNGRVYSILIFFQLIAFYLFIRKDFDKYKYLWTIISAFCVYLHALSLILTFYQFVYLVVKKQKVKYFLLIFLILTLPYFFNILYQILLRKEVFTAIGIQKTYIDGILENITMIGGKLEENYRKTGLYQLTQGPIALILGITGITLFCLVIFKQNCENRLLNYTIGSIFLTYLVVPPIFNYLTNTMFYPKYSLFLIPLNILFISILLQKNRTRILKHLFLLLVCVNFLYIDIYMLNQETSMQRQLSKKQLAYLKLSDKKIVTWFSNYYIFFNTYGISSERMVLIYPERFSKIINSAQSHKIISAGNFISAPSECKMLTKYSENGLIVFQILIPKFFTEDPCYEQIKHLYEKRKHTITSPFSILFETNPLE